MERVRNYQGNNVFLCQMREFVAAHGYLTNKQAAVVLRIFRDEGGGTLRPKPRRGRVIR